MFDFKIIMDLQNNIIVIIDYVNKEMVYGNKSFENFFGLNVSDFKSSFRCICEKFILKDNYLHGTVGKDSYLLSHILNNPSEIQRVFMEDQNGYFHHFEVYAKKLDDKHFVVIFNNVTDLILIQEELEIEEQILKEYIQAIDSTTIVSKTDIKGNITYINQQFIDISGYSKEELIGKPHNIVRHHDMDSSVFKDLWGTIQSGRKWRGIVTNRKKNGGFYIVDATVTPVFDKEGNIKEYMAIRKDITESDLEKKRLMNLRK